MRRLEEMPLILSSFGRFIGYRTEMSILKGKKVNFKGDFDSYKWQNKYYTGNVVM